MTFLERTEVRETLQSWKNSGVKKEDQSGTGKKKGQPVLLKHQEQYKTNWRNRITKCLSRIHKNSLNKRECNTKLVKR